MSVSDKISLQNLSHVIKIICALDFQQSIRHGPLSNSYYNMFISLYKYIDSVNLLWSCTPILMDFFLSLFKILIC